ncbi:hypothetical protein ACFSUS_27975 [Spirosoma soli]|uniref:TonB C-terminal domain-containing protein n=1 Tax=Spirosoma soli TaxID=1770529 RepID=A0ABW5MEI2_9BACT
MQYIVLLLVLLLFSAAGQPGKIIKVKSHYFIEEYEVQASNDTIRTGIYKKYFRDGNNLLEEGQYNSNKRVGTWTFYNRASKPELVYDYSINKIVMTNRAIKDSTGIIQQADSTVTVWFETPPVYLASSQQIFGILVRESKFPAHLQRAGLSQLSYQIVATISPVGAHYRVVTSHNDKEFVKNAQQASQLAFKDVQWLPAVYDGKVVTALYRLDPVTLNGFSIRR